MKLLRKTVALHKLNKLITSDEPNEVIERYLDTLDIDEDGITFTSKSPLFLLPYEGFNIHIALSHSDVTNKYGSLMIQGDFPDPRPSIYSLFKYSSEEVGSARKRRDLFRSFGITDYPGHEDDTIIINGNLGK